MEIVLTWEEVKHGAMIGVQRNIEQMMKGAEDAYGYDRDLGWQDHIVGALGEYALAKMRGLTWDIGKVRAPDVGDAEVKTVREKWHRLIIHKETPDDRPCWLVCCDDPQFRRYRVLGYLPQARQGKLEEFWQDPTHKKRHAYFVPVKHLSFPPGR